VIMAMPDPLDFGKVCLGTFKDLPLTIKNKGECALTISGITFSSPEFKLASAVAFPLVIPPGGMRDVIIRLEPTSTGPKSAKITINSDDPATPNLMVMAMGLAPVSMIEVTGPTDWGEVTVGKFKDLVLYVRNTEPCDLLVTLICELKDGPLQLPTAEFNITSPINYPILIPGGTMQPVMIRFKPEKKGPRNAKLIVFGYDPKTSALLLNFSVPLKGTGK
jgi:HYDIN/CFA65/VesB family protein